MIKNIFFRFFLEFKKNIYFLFLDFNSDYYNGSKCEYTKLCKCVSLISVLVFILYQNDRVVRKKCQCSYH